MKNLFFLLFISLQSAVYTQKDTILIVRSNTLSDEIRTIDTFLFDSPLNEQILVGTCVLPSTRGQIMSWGRGIYFDKVTKTDCNNHGEEVYRDETHINNFTINDTSLIVDMTFIDNCCYEFLCDIEIGDDGILHLNYTGYGTFCSCNCCFGVQYHLTLDRSVEDYNLKGIMFGNNEKTLRRIE